MTGTDPTADQARLDAAEAMRQSGRLEEAEAAFLAELRRRPGNLPATLGAGRCALKRGAFARAADLLRHAAEKGKYPWPLLELGADCRKAGHFDEAEAAYRHALALAPETPEPVLGLAACARRRGQFLLALERQTEACALAPGNLAARLELGRDLQRLERFDEAADVFAAVLQEEPNDPKALEAAAALARRTGDRDRSLHLLKRAVGQASSDGAAGPAPAEPSRRGASAWMKIGQLERARGDAAAATAAFEQAHAAEPENPKIIRQLAREYRALGDLGRADELTALAARIDPQSPEAAGGAGKPPPKPATAQAPSAKPAASIRALLDDAREQRAAGDLAAAEAVYRQAAGIAPQAAEPLVGLAACARTRGERQAAHDLQRQAWSLAPADAAVGVQLGKDLLKLQRPDEAAAAFDAVLAAHPGHPAASKAAAFIARQRGDAARAIALLRDAAEGCERTGGADSAALWLKIAGLERAREDHQAAVQAMERAHAAAPQNLEIIWKLAREHRGLGARSRSDAMIRLAAQLDPEGKLAPSRNARRAMLALLAADARRDRSGRQTRLATARALLAQAKARRLADGDRAAACELQRQACDLAPEDWAARLQLGKDLQKLDRLDEAAAAFDAVLSARPTDAAALKAAASLARQSGDKQRAVTLLKQAMEQSPEPQAETANPAAASVWLRIGVLERSAGHYEAAVTAFEQAHAADPRNVEIIRQLAREHRVLGNQARCNALLDLAGTLDPQAQPPAHANESHPEVSPAEQAPAGPSSFSLMLTRAQTAAKAGALDQAEACYRQAADIQPTSAKPLLGLAACARRRGDGVTALDLQRQAYRLAPEDTASGVQLAKDLGRLGRLGEAAGVMAGVLARAPADARALKAAASLALEQGDQAAALQLFKRSMAVDPKAADRGNAAVWLQIGVLERAAGNPEGALAAFERAHAADPANAKIARRLALRYRALGNQERYAEMAAIVKRLGRKERRSVTRAAEQALLGNDAERALDLYRGGIAKNPSTLSLYLGAGAALMRLGRIDEAESLMDEAAQRCGSSAALYARRAQMLRDTGRTRQALELARQGHAAFPDSFLLWEAVMRLLGMIGSDAELAAWRVAAPVTTDEERATVAALAGDAEEAAGKPADAASLYAHAASLQPEQPAHHAALARTSLAVFDIPAAARHLADQAAIQEDLPSPAARSGGSAKGYFDHVINEYRLESRALDQVAALPADPPSRAAALRGLLREHPENTLVAAALVDAMWRAGALGPMHGRAEPIPPRIVQYWEAGEPPGELRPLMESWRTANPGVFYERFDDKSARAFLSRTCAQEVLFAYHRAVVPSLKSDLFRLAYLARQGGIYADPDQRCIEPVRRLLPAGADLVLCRERLGMLDNSLIAATPEHPIIVLALAQAAAAINRGDRDALRLSTGPGLLTRCVAQRLAEAAAEPPFGLQVWTERAVQPVVALRCAAAGRAMLPYRTRTPLKRLRNSDAAGPVESEFDPADRQPWDSL